MTDDFTIINLILRHHNKYIFKLEQNIEIGAYIKHSIIKHIYI